VDPEVRRVVDFVWHLVEPAANAVRADNPARGRSVAVFNVGCDRARACYRHVASASPSRLPRDLRSGNVPVVLLEHDDVMRIAGTYYRLEEHAEPALEPGDVRVIVMTARTLSLLRLAEGGKPRVCAPVVRAVETNVLRMASAAYRNDVPGGILFHQVFKTRQQGDDFTADLVACVADMTHNGVTKERAEDELRAWIASKPRGSAPNEAERIDLFGHIGWLEKQGHLVTDTFNGIELYFGREEDLELADELVRAMTPSGSKVI
jgi:hypothetical protein